jgi:peroxidase
VIDAIKTRVEAACKATVSCADIVALAARDAVNLVSEWTFLLPYTSTQSQCVPNADLLHGSSGARRGTYHSAGRIHARRARARPTPTFRALVPARHHSSQHSGRRASRRVR